MDVLINIIVIIMQYISISNHHVKYLKHTQCYMSSTAQVKAMVFLVVMYGCESWNIKLSTKELMLLNCGVGEDP